MGCGISIKGKTLLADTNYFSEDNLRTMKEKGINAVIPDNQFRSRDERFSDRDRFKPEKKGVFKRTEHFIYNEREDEYQCPNGKFLKFSKIEKLNDHTMKKYICRKSDCDGCELRSRCISGKKGTTKYRTLMVSVKVDNRNHSKEMRALIDTPEGRDLYSKRMGIIEPVFSNMTYCKKMERLTLRGQVKC